MAGLMMQAAVMLSACSMKGDVDPHYTMQLDEGRPLVERDISALAADRRLPNIPMGDGALGVTPRRLIAIGPVGGTREGLLVLHDLRDRGTRTIIDGIPVKHTIEITSEEGGIDMVDSFGAHPVMLSRVVIDCRRAVMTTSSYHTADTYAGPFAFTFVVQPPRREVSLSGSVRRNACTRAPGGIADPGGRIGNRRQTTVQ